jgi:hypothetical protein
MRRWLCHGPRESSLRNAQGPPRSRANKAIEPALVVTQIFRPVERLGFRKLLPNDALANGVGDRVLAAPKPAYLHRAARHARRFDVPITPQAHLNFHYGHATPPCFAEAYRQSGADATYPARGRRTGDFQSRARFSRSELPITLTELSAIAAPAMIGDKRIPSHGYRTPAAIGTPAAL